MEQKMPKIPAIERISISEIIKNPDNPRVIRDKKYQNLVNSIRDFPQMLEIRPIVVNENNIILGGNQRYEACKEIGFQILPVIRAGNLTEEQKKKFIIKDNVTAGEWDYTTLANKWDVEILKDWGIDDITSKTKKKRTRASDEMIDKGFYSFSRCNKELTTNGIYYYAIFRNNGMDLDELKKSELNLDIFTWPVVQIFKRKNVENVIVAPKGDRFENNGFHFASKLVEQVKDIIDINIYEPFQKNGRKIVCNDSSLPPRFVIFDDIVTFGTTIKNMAEKIGTGDGIIILITNH